MSVIRSKVLTTTSCLVTSGSRNQRRDIVVVRYGNQSDATLTIPAGPKTCRTVTIDVNVADLIEALRRCQGSSP